MISREQQKEKYESIKFNYNPDDMSEDKLHKYSLRNNFGIYFESKKLKAIQELLNFAKITLKGKKILDLGCHRGLYSNFFSYLSGDSNMIYGIDFQESFIEQAKKINPGINYLQKDWYNLDFKDESFDMILAIYIVNAMPQEEIAIITENIQKKVEVGGYIIIFDFYRSGSLAFLKDIYAKFKGIDRNSGLNDRIIKRYFPNFEIIKSQKFLNIGLRVNTIVSKPILAEICELILPSEYYIAIIKKN